MPETSRSLATLACAILLLAAQGVPAQAETITPIADAVRGEAVTLRGSVVALLDEDEFRLQDGSGSIVVYLGPEPPQIRRGEALTVRGQIDDDWPRELYAREIVRADGATVPLRRDSWR